MAKPRNRTSDYLTYILIRLTVALYRAMPFTLATRSTKALAWILMRITKKRILVGRENLNHAFPGKYTTAELDNLIETGYEHFCRMMVEAVWADRMISKRNYREYIVFPDLEMTKQYTRALLGDRPVLLVTGHFGNWELSGVLMGLLGFPSYAIARPLDNTFLDAWFRRWRQQNGQKIIAKKGEFDLIEEALRKGGSLATLGDQDAGSRGMFVNFFNRPASTHKAVALLAMGHDALMVVTGTARIGNGYHYHLYFEDFIDPRDYQHQPDAVRAITTRYTEALERMIRRHPEQYLWIHRRWKHQPAASKRKAAA